jgi:TonB-dependent receptor
MSRLSEVASLFLFSTALIAPGVAVAQVTSNPAPPTGDQVQAGEPDATGELPTPAETQADEQEVPDVSIPGAGDIVVTGRRDANIQRSTAQVVSILSSADIARTGEGDIAGALSRVTGLSVVGNGFVYVRGLGDRYSSALLNGLPLPSPEPLRRVVPLDLFPSSIIASSLVQKSYSVNFPGEFGGGVINLTTKTAPKESFLSVGGSASLDTQTTARLGYTYFGTKSDWTGFGDGSRRVPPLLQQFFDSGNRITDPGVDQQAIAGQLINGNNALIQRNTQIPLNTAATLNGGTSFDVGDVTLGVIATAGYSNKWRTRDIIQQTANTLDLSSTNQDYRRVVTDNHVVVNGLLGLSAEFGRNKVRATGLYIRDTLKQARLGIGEQVSDSPGVTFLEQDTAWFARQLIDTQLVGEFRLSDALSLDVRGSYANSRRDSPDEIGLTYVRSNNAADPYGAYFLNTLNIGGNPGTATIAFSKLDENLWSGGADLSYKLNPDFTFTVGYAYSDTNRRTDRRSFLFQGNNQVPLGVSMFRPDYLLQQSVIDAFGIGLTNNEGGNPSYRAKLRNHAGYAQLQAQLTDKLSLNGGVRFETATQTVAPIKVFNVNPTLPPATDIKRDYWLPALTVTYQLMPEMQVRVSGSKTIARPQFRELVYQTFYDPESNVAFRGNPQLTDSQLYNAEARWEWYYARDQRVSLSGFFKRIDHPIETYASFDGNNVFTSFANAPRANLYGGEIETQKYFDLSGLGDEFFQTRRAVVVANYTYSHSALKVGPDDPVAAFPLSVTRANQLFRDGSPLTGQSDHLVNLELGLEDQDHLSQQTLLLSYASIRTTRRGPSGQADIREKPGFHLDFVAREAVEFGSVPAEIKFEVRNITGTKFQEYQQNGDNRIYYNLYNVGTTGALGIAFNF